MPTSSSSTLREALTEAAWAQWTTLGVLGSTSLRETRCIDPEALVWLTFASGIADGRLVETAGTWLGSNKHLISVHRLRNVFGEDTDPLDRVIDALRRSGGKSKSRFEVSSKTAAPDPKVPANLAIRLRYLMDAGVRSEVARFLVTHHGQGADAQAVADAAMFAKRNAMAPTSELVCR